MKRFEFFAAAVLAAAVSHGGTLFGHLTGGQYRIGLVVTDPAESWPAEIVLDVDDGGGLKDGTIRYPTEACRGKVAGFGIEGDTLILRERIVEGEAECPPGRYLLRFAPKTLYAEPSVNRFSAASFELEGERSPARFDRWRYDPTPEGRYRIATRGEGWPALKKRASPKEVWAYLEQVRGGSYEKEAVARLAALLLRDGDTEGMMRFLNRYPETAEAAEISDRLVAALKRAPDWALARKLAAFERLRPRVASVMKTYVLHAGTPDGLLRFLERFGPEPEVTAALDGALRRGALSWDELLRAAELRTEPLSGRALSRMLRQASEKGDARKLWTIVGRFPARPQAKDALAGLLRMPGEAGKHLQLLDRDPYVALYEKALVAAFGDPGSKVPVRLAESIAAQGRERLRAATLPVLLERLGKGASVEAAAEAEALWALTKRLDVRWKVRPDKNPDEAKLTLDSGAWPKPLVLSVPVSCRVTGTKEYTRSYTVTALLIIPVAEERARFRRTDFDCAVKRPASVGALADAWRRYGVGVEGDGMPTRLAATAEKRLEVLSTTPNAIGEAMLREANAPAGCKAMRAQCEAHCIGADESNGGFIVPSDREECESLCYDAFYNCTKR